MAAEHIAELGDLIVDLVHAHADEIGEHDLGDRPLAGEGRAGRRADDGGLGDRRVDHAAGPELVVEAGGGSPDAADRFLPPGGAGAADDVLAEHDQVGVALHLGVEHLVDDFADGELSHERSDQ